MANPIKIACLDDEEKVIEEISTFLSRIKKENNIDFELHTFTSPFDFLESQNYFHIILLDVEMKGMNGMEVASKIREHNQDSIIIFVTNSIEFAVQGYSVNALDYVLKPLNYTRFSILILKALRMSKTQEHFDIFVKNDGTIERLNTANIIFIDVDDHLLVYHTLKGEFTSWASLSSVEESLPEDIFIRINHNTIVNMKFINKVEKVNVYVSGYDEPLQISKSRKKMFFASFKDHS